MKSPARNQTSQLQNPNRQTRTYTLLATLLVILTSAALSSCSGYTVSSAALGQPSSNPGASTPGAGVLTPGSTSLSFGNMAVGITGTQTVNLTNTGTAAVSISKATISGAAFTIVGTTPSGSVGVGQSDSVQIQFAPLSDSAVTGILTVTSNASNSPLTIPLSGTGMQAMISATPASVNFGTVVKGNSNSQTITLQNGGNSTLTFSQVTPPGAGFSMSGLSTATTIPAGGSFAFNAIFTPLSAASVNGSITLVTNGTPSTLTIPLSGVGSAVKVNPSSGTLSTVTTSLNFGNVAVGSVGTQTVNLSNTGSAAVNISTATIFGAAFTIVGGSPSGSIPVGQGTSLQVRFTPLSDSSVTGTLTVTSDASNSPLTIPLAGTGLQAQISAMPASVNFGTVVKGTSNSQTITLQNGGNSTLTFSKVTPPGAGFTISGLSTATTIPAGGSVAFNAIFTPTTTAAVNGSITLATNGAPASLTIALSGTGGASTVQLGAAPTSLNFNTISVGNSTSLSSTLTNSGNSNITISSVTATGAGVTTSGLSAGMILAPQQSAVLTITFTPTAAIVLTGANVKIASNAPNSPITITLAGTGQAAPTSHSVALSWTPSTTAGVSGYNVYRATTSGGYGTTPVNPSPVTGATYTDTTVVSGQTYFYVATAVDSGEQSVDSNEVQAVIP
jgi:hypothetical protein